MKLKRLVSLLLIFSLLATFCGCGDTDERTRAAKELDLEGPVTLNIWYNDSSYEAYLQFVAESFAESNELVTVNPVYIEADSYIGYIYDESVRNDNACDVYLLTSEEVEKAYLMGIMSENDIYSDVYNEDVFGKAAITACSYKDKLYGYPVSFNASFLVYNTKYAEAVSTIDEIQEISDNYQITEDNESVTMVFTWDCDSMFLNYPALGAYLNIGGEASEDSSDVSVDTDNVKKVLTKFATLNSVFGITRGETSIESCVEEFSGGGLLYTIMDADNLTQIDLSGVEYGICEYPSMGDDLESRTMSVTTMAVVNPYTANVDASKALARAISYDYADYLEVMAGKCCARGDLVINGNAQSYAQLHAIYSESAVKAKYIGVGEIYMRLEIMLHQVYDGTDVESAYRTFASTVEKTGTINESTTESTSE